MATDINTVTLTGRLVASMELRRTQNAYAIGNFCIAVNRAKKQQDGQWVEEASFFDCAIYGKSAENLQQYLVKGKGVTISGYLEQDRWEKEGQHFSRVRIVVDRLKLDGSIRNGTPTEAAVPQSHPAAPARQANGAPAFTPEPADFEYGEQQEGILF